jgi:hypothetical protein
MSLKLEILEFAGKNGIATLQSIKSGSMVALKAIKSVTMATLKSMKSSSGIIVVRNNNEAEISWREEIKDTFVIALSSAVLSSLINIFIQLILGSSFSTIIQVILFVSLLVSFYAIIYKIIEMALRQFKREDLSQNSKAVLAAMVVGLVGYVLKTQYFDISSDRAIINSIVSAIITLMINLDYSGLRKPDHSSFIIATLSPTSSPDGPHINKKGALFVIALVLIGVYCIFADAPFSWLFGTTSTVIEVVK